MDPISDASELAKELRTCDVYCYPSIAEQGETFGVAPLEAMAVGCATVVSALECFQDFVDDGVSALVFNHRVDNPAEQLAERIEYFLTNPDSREKVATEGSRVAHTKFSNDHIAKQYLADFHSLLSDKKYAKQ